MPTYLEETIDPTSVGFSRPSLCERECLLVIAVIRQGFEDADKIGRGVRVAGETSHPGTTEAANREHVEKLEAWMYRPARFGIASLAYCCEVLEMRSGERFNPADVRKAIRKALRGETPPTLIDWRTVNRVYTGASDNVDRTHHERSRTMAALVRDRKRYALKVAKGMEVAA